MILAYFFIFNNTDLKEDPKEEEKEFIDCIDDLNCFKNKLDNCHPSKINHTSEIYLDGMIRKTNFIFSLENHNDVNKCILNLKVDSVDFEISPEMLSSFESNPDFNIEEIENQIKEIYKEMEGITSYCILDTKEIKDVFKEWIDDENNIYNSQDLECFGAYFIKDLYPDPEKEPEEPKKEYKTCKFNSDCDEGYTCLDKKCMNPETVDECLDLPPLFLREQCIKIVALKEKDANICTLMNVSKSTFNSVEIDCFTEIAIENNDYSVCEILKEIKEKGNNSYFNCYEKFAIIKNNPEACNQTTIDRNKQNCLNLLSVIEKYPEIDRNKLINNSWHYIAKDLDDPEICNFATSSFDKRDCENYFNND